MNPTLSDYRFGSITVNEAEIEHDIIIRLSGKVDKRKKRLSKEIFGTSHIISLDEAKYIYEEGAKRLIIGAGKHGMVSLSAEAEEFFREKDCKAELFITSKAIEKWNTSTDPAIGLFHITC